MTPPVGFDWTQFGAEVGGDFLSGALNTALTGGTIGGSEWTRAKRSTRQNYEYAMRYMPRLVKKQSGAALTGTVNAAKAAGLHPLFALGGASGGGGAPAFSMPGQSPTGSFMDLGASAVRALTKPATDIEKETLKQARIQTQLLQLELDKVKNPVAKPQPANPHGIVDATMDAYSTIQQPAPPQPHPTHYRERGAVNADGKDITVPRGTPGDFWEQEFGELGDMHPENIKRFFRHLVDNDYLPSRNDWRDLYSAAEGLNEKQKKVFWQGMQELLESRIWYFNRLKDEARARMQKRYDRENRRVDFIRNKGAG